MTLMFSRPVATSMLTAALLSSALAGCCELQVYTSGFRITLEATEAGFEIVSSEQPETPLALLAPIARAASELVTQADPRRLRCCAAPECATWFVDSSKGGAEPAAALPAADGAAPAAAPTPPPLESPRAEGRASPAL